MRAEKGKASFIIVNWNGQETIAECLDSIFSQTYKNNEIIFIDNNSSDDSLELVKKNYTVDKLIILDRNYGYAEANNLGLKHASGEYIALVNNDTVLKNDWLEKAVAVFRKCEYKNLGSVATKIINYHNKNLIDSAGVEYYGFGACWDYKNLLQDSPEVNQRKEVFGACASAALYRKELIDEIGLFDPNYFIYFEDTELAFRLRLFGYNCIYEPKAVSYHYGSRRRDKSNKFYIDFGRRNIEFLFIKNMQGTLFTKYFLSHYIYESALFFFFLFVGKGIPFIKAKIDVLNNLGYLLKERKDLRLTLMKLNKFKDINKVERYFLHYTLRGLFNKIKKAIWTYKIYMNLN